MTTSPLASLAQATPLNRLDLALAAFLQQAQPSEDPRHSWLAALVSHQYGRGHACLDLAALQREPGPTLGWEAQALQALPAELTDWVAAADSLPWVHGPCSPLVREGQRLYLRRNWEAEQAIRQSIEARLALPPKAPVGLAQALAQLFPPDAAVPGPDWQKVACALAARQRLTLVTGGPGTGKTTTVVRLLALLQSHARAQQGRPLRVALAAPTGKAAARLGESIASAIASLPEALRADIPAQAATLHKLLQVRPGGGTAAPVPALALDLVVVDEASMIDLEMMARLLRAVPLHASVILLGDKDQLASVEAGAVMGQLCHGAQAGRYSAATVAWLAEVAGVDLGPWQGDGGVLAQQTVMLRHSRRFAGDSPIGQWARAVNAGDVVTVRQLWQQAPVAGRSSDSVQRLQPRPGGDPALAPLWRQGWQPRLDAQAPNGPGGSSDAQALQALAALARFQVLCAVREGAWGVQALNRRIALALGFPPEGWYPGRPVMATRNDYALKLMNGDIGLCLPHAKGLRVAFPDGAGSVHWVQPSRLDAVESVFAMTVHKSQGSEFEHVCLVLPEQPVAVLTRELLYTGITRAKTRLTLAVPAVPVLMRAVERQIVRSGGLAM